MEAIYRSKNGMIFTDSLEAIKQDAKDGAFTMYDKTGAVTLDLSACCAVFIENSKGTKDFNDFRADCERWTGCAKAGCDGEGFAIWDDYIGGWTDLIPPAIFLRIAANVLPVEEARHV